MTTTLGGVTLPNVSRINPSKESNLFNQPLPYSNSNETILMDIFGTTRSITVEGKFTGETAAIQAFIASIEAIQNGQQEGSAFACDLYSSPKTVVIQSFSPVYNEGAPTLLEYSLTLQEGTVI